MIPLAILPRRPAYPAIALPGAATPTRDRKIFWRAFLDWLSHATADETEQLEQVLAEHAHHVRPLIEAISDALNDVASAGRLPATLLAELVAANWQPHRSFAAQAA